MRKNNCEVMRRELDELMLEETCSSAAMEHLRECAACREFHQQQTKLRQMVGGLGTVAAPPDFDFRLRARLAGESNGASFQYWPFARRGLAVAAVLIVLATGIVVVRNVMNRPQEVITANDQPVVPQPAPAPVDSPKPAMNPEEFSAAVPANSPRRIKNERPTEIAPKNRRPVATRDFSFERADVINGSVAASSAFPIDASLQSLKVSLDDGRGNARTISVPTISFGSQRVLQSGNQFAPKGVW
jgi:hypothetical protein